MPNPEVRRCARCGQSALVPFQDWERRVVGIALPTRSLELQCRACGHKVLLHPKAEIRAARILAYLTLPAIVPSLIFFARARRKERGWLENPVVEGAAWQPLAPPSPAMPLDERGTAIPDRRCDCSATARCTQIALKGSWDIRLGFALDYRCPRCSKRFKISSVGHLVSIGLLGAVLASVGALLVVHPAGTAVGAEQANRGFGLGLAALGAAWLLFLMHRLRVRAAHRIVN